MLIARRPSRIRAPIYWSTALEALGDFVFRFAFFIWPLALDQLEVAIAFGGDVLRDVGVEHRGLLHQCPVLRGKLARQAGARRDGEPQCGPLTVDVEGLLWGRTHATLDIDETGSSNRDWLLTLLRSCRDAEEFAYTASSPPRRVHQRCRRQENGYRHQTDRHDPRRCDASAAFKVDVLPDVHVEPP